MGLDDGKNFSQLGTSCELLAMSTRDSPPDPVHCAEGGPEHPDDL